jgi:predicted transcriptional regulator
MISSHELSPRAKTIRRSARRHFVLFKKSVDLEHTIASHKQPTQLITKNIMSPSSICVDGNDDIGEAICTLVRADAYMLPAVENDTVVGILTRCDSIRFLAQEL